MSKGSLLMCFASLLQAAWRRAVCITISVTIVAAHTSHAGSATWNLNPTSGDWNTAANWTPAIVPDQETDVATFDVSNITSLSVSYPGVGIGRITFNPGASAYNIVGIIAFLGAGVVNNSGVTQNFDNSDGFGFGGRATAGDGVIYTNSGETISNTAFANSSNAGSATFINKGDSTGRYAALLEFNENSSAANATILNEQGDTGGGGTFFADDSSAGNSVITVEPGATLKFENNSTGGTATLLADGGTIFFEGGSNGNLARVELINGGLLDLSTHNNAAVMAIGSLEGDSTSTVRPLRQKFTVGGNGRSTTFSGVITQNGSLVKTGSEQLTLTGANTYEAGTTITAGTLLAQAGAGSATGTGPVMVNAGTLGGIGRIAGAVIVGAGNGQGAYLAPGVKGPDALAISKTLTFRADGIYKCELDLSQAKADQVATKGVTIESGAQFVLLPRGFQTLTLGTVFTVINNTAVTPISGTFANLADGSIISALAGNKLQVSYEGGTGNDLTLTVVP